MATLPADATSYDDTSVTPLQQYWYRVSGVEASGAAGPSSTVSDVDPADETGLGPAVTTPLPDVTLMPGWTHSVDMDDYFSYGGVTKTQYTVSGDTNPGLFERIPVFFSGLPDTLYFEADPNSLGGTADITIDYTAQTGAFAESTFTVTVLPPQPVLNRTGPRGLDDNPPTDPGAMTIASGTLTVNDSGALDPETNVVIADGSSLVLGFGSSTSTTDSVMSDGTLEIGDGTDDTTSTLDSDIKLMDNATLEFNSSGAQTFANAILDGVTSQDTTDIGSVMKEGSGTVTLSGPDTYTGSTTILAGGIAAGSTTGLSSNSVITVDQGATLDLAGNDSSIAGLAGDSGSIVQSSGGLATLKLVGSSDTTFSGTLQDGTAAGSQLALDMAGGGTFTLTATNTYTGPTTVTAGTLDVEGSISNSVVTVNGGTLIGLFPPQAVKASPSLTTYDDNTPMTITGTFSQIGTPQADTVYVDWGDGTTGNPDVVAYPPNPDGASFTIPAPQYAAAGNYTIKVWVEDPAGDSSPVVTLPPVNYTPIAPSGLSLTLDPTTVEAGDDVELTGTFNDPRSLVGDTVTIDWGDGTTGAPDVTTLTLDSGVHSFAADPQVYEAAGSYTITVTVANDVGSVKATKSETVTFTPPSDLTLTPSPMTLAEGDDAVLSGTFDDPRDLVGDTVTIDWGDGTTGTPDVTTMTLDPTDQRFTADPQTYDTAGNYTITVTVANDAGSTQATTSVSVLPVVAAVADVPTAAEMGQEPGEFTVSREDSGVATDLTVNYTLAGSAVNGTDYQALYGVAKIPAGQTETTVEVTPVDLGIIGGDKAATLTLTPASDGSYVVDSDYTNATVTIHDNDMPTVSLAAADPGTTLSESLETGGSFVVSRTGPTDNALLVPYDVSGSAANGDDYEALSGTVVIPAGSSSPRSGSPPSTRESSAEARP